MPGTRRRRPSPFRFLVFLFLGSSSIFCSGPVCSEDPAPGAVLPAEAPPPAAAVGPRWRIRPWAGVSTVRLGGLDSFPQATLRRLEPGWQNLYGARVTKRSRTLINFAVIEGLDAAFQLDPMVSAAVRVGRLQSQEGRTFTRAEGGGYLVKDEWLASTEMLLLGGGATFHLPVRPRWKANVSLFLGAGLGTVRLDHHLALTLPGGLPAGNEGSGEGTGTAFVPEFALELERELSGDLSAGLTAGVRFGGVESFDTRWQTSFNAFSSLPEVPLGTPLRDVDGRLLSADYAGFLLTLWLAARL